MMLHKLAVRISEHFKKLNILQVEQEIYIYGIELILGDILNFIILLIVASFLNRILEMAIWSTVFLISKRYTGGYHAPSHLLCILTLQTGFIASYFLCEYLNPSACIWLESIVIICGISLPASFGPIGSYKKPITKSIYQKKKKKLYLFIGIISLIFLSVLFLFPSEKEVLYAFAAYLFNLIMIPPGYIDNKMNCGTGSGIAVENDEVSDKVKIKNKNRSFFEILKENKEIVDYVTRIYENNDPFERTWIASYELPYFVSCRINKSDHYNEAKKKIVNKQINRWCVFVTKYLN